MKVKFFKDVAEKQKLFGATGYRQIKSMQDLEAWLTSLDLGNEKLHWNFRGLNNASYRLYTSFQRFWAERHLDDLGMNHLDAIKGMIDEAKKPDNALAKYYKALHIKSNDWLVLAFLQHYGAATPLLDFTRDPNVAFYFAILGASHLMQTTSELEHYVSVYYYSVTHNGSQLSTLTKVARSRGFTSRTRLTSWLTFENVVKAIDPHQAIVIPSGPNGRLNTVVGKTHINFPTGNLNSLSQDGEFVCNLSAQLPLDEVLNSNETHTLKCVDIHKCLLERIVQERLGGSMEAAAERYFTQEEHVARRIQNSILKRLP